MKIFRSLNQIQNLKFTRTTSVLVGIVFGIAVLFSLSQESSLVDSGYVMKTDSFAPTQVQVVADTPKYSNFLASYFLQESSIERKNVENSEKGTFLSNLKDFRNIFISKVWATL